jgi:hypothetical protein
VISHRMRISTPGAQLPYSGKTAETIRPESC